MQCDRNRVRQLLLTTSSALALIAGLNAGAQAAICTPIVVPAANAASIDCIMVSGTGNYTNSGSIRNAILGGGTATAAIFVVTTLSGTIQNTGTIVATIPGATGI